MNPDNLRLDGNAISGLLREFFQFEMSDARSTCAGCAAVKPVGELMVYRHAMGTVVRCAGCDNVLMCIVSVSGKYRLNFSGMSAFEINPKTH